MPSFNSSNKALKIKWNCIFFTQTTLPVVERTGSVKTCNSSNSLQILVWVCKRTLCDLKHFLLSIVILSNHAKLHLLGVGKTCPRLQNRTFGAFSQIKVFAFCARHKTFIFSNLSKNWELHKSVISWKQIFCFPVWNKTIYRSFDLYLRLIVSKSSRLDATRTCQRKCSTGEQGNKITNRARMQLQERCDTLLMRNGYWQNTSWLGTRDTSLTSANWIPECNELFLYRQACPGATSLVTRRTAFNHKSTLLFRQESLWMSPVTLIKLFCIFWLWKNV